VNENIVTKIFDIGSSEKFTRELEFYKWCSLNNLKQVPALRSYSKEKHQIKIDYLKGSRPTNISRKIESQIIKFMYDLNNNQNSESLPKAAEAIMTDECLVNHLCYRFDQVYLETRYHPKKFLSIVQKTINEQKKQLIDPGKILVNPSDLGLHNMINWKEKIYFFDFEYAGRDSYIKFLLDFCIHPENMIKSKDISYYNNIFSNALGMEPMVLSSSVIKAFYVWWVMRLINSIKDEVINKRFEKGLIPKDRISGFKANRIKSINIFWNHVKSF